MQYFNEAQLRKMYEHITKDSGHLIMTEEELRKYMKRYPDGTLFSVARSLGLDSEPTESGLPSNPAPKPEVKVADLLPDAPIAESNVGPAIRELKKWVEGETASVKRAIAANSVSNGKALTQAINNRTEVQRLAEMVKNSITNQEKMLSAQMNAISNNVTAYISSGGSGNGKVEPLSIHFHLPDGQVTRLEGQHTVWNFEKYLRLQNAFIDLNLVGPKGSGKSTITRQLAEARGVPLYRTDLSGGASEAKLTCRLTGIDQRPIASEFLCGYGGYKNVLREDGKVWPEYDETMVGQCVLEEADSPDPTVMVVLNGATGDIGPTRSSFLSSEHFAAVGLPAKVWRGKRNTICACMNTFGTGMDLQYAGRQAQDAAWMDRLYNVFVDYDEVLEAKIGNLPIPLNRPMWIAAPEPSLSEWQNLARWVIGVRQVLRDAGMRLDWGTRALLKAKAARYAGVSSGEVQGDLLLGLPADVIDKALKFTPKASIGPGSALGAHLGALQS